MYKLVLKVEECRKDKALGLYRYTCKDKFDINYSLTSKCFKQLGNYILVTFGKYNVVANDLEMSEQINLTNIKNISELQVINNKLTLNTKQVKSDILKEVEKLVTKHSIDELKELIKKNSTSMDYSDHLDTYRRYEREKIHFECELKRLKKYLNIA